MFTLHHIPVLAQVDPATIATVLTAPNGFLALAIVAACGLFWQNQRLHEKHTDLLEKVLPISLKLAEAVERLERRLDTMGIGKAQT